MGGDASKRPPDQGGDDRLYPWGDGGKDRDQGLYRWDGTAGEYIY